MAAAKPDGCISVQATDPLYILYTSGTTGQSKGIIRDNGGHAVALKWSMKNIYDVDPGQVYWAASDIGWVVGHSYIVYGPLFHGCTTVLYEGKPVGTPDAGAFWRGDRRPRRGGNVHCAHRDSRAIRQHDPDGALISEYDLSRFRTLFLAGERLDPDTLGWATKSLGVPVIDHWWQTETGWAIAATCLGIEAPPVVPGSPGPRRPDGTWLCSVREMRSFRPGRSERSAPDYRCHPRRFHPSGTPMRGSSIPTSPDIPGSTRRPMPDSSMSRLCACHGPHR